MAQDLMIGGITYNGVESMEMTNTAGEKIVYVEKVNTGTGVYVAQIGEQKFYTVEAALAAAASGETVRLIADCVENVTLVVPVGSTFDLNGKTLEAGNVIGMASSHVIDSKSNKGNVPGGILKVEKNRLALDTNNKHMPVWNGVDGYVFSSISFSNHKLTKDTANDTASLTFTPWFDYYDENFVMTDAASTGVKALVRSSWTIMNADGTVNGIAAQDFEFSDSQLQYVVQQQGKKALKMSLFGYSSKMGLTMTAMVVSDAGVTIGGTKNVVVNA